MIKLVITDLDGTLLDDAKNLPDEFWEIQKKLHEKGITWVIASGRQYYTIADQFGQILNEVYILAENGALVMKGDREVHMDPLDRQLSNRFIERSRPIDNVWPVLCCKKSAYIEDDYEPLLREAKKYYKRLDLVDDLTLVEDTVLKFTLCDFQNAETNSFRYYRQEQDKARVTAGGEIWLDITSLTATKGTAFRKIMHHCNVEPEEVMAFGDYLNDRELMEIAYHSYAMKNAHPDLMESARNVTVYDNNNNGVLRELIAYFNL